MVIDKRVHKGARGGEGIGSYVVKKKKKSGLFVCRIIFCFFLIPPPPPSGRPVPAHVWS